MLILDLQDSVIEEKRKFFRKKKTNKEIFHRSNFKYNNKVHAIISISENMLESERFSKLIKLFDGQILACDDSRINDVIDDYRFDVKPYYKEAVFSSLCNFMSCDKGINTICIRSNDFEQTTKILELVKLCKNVVLETEPTIELQRFCDECYLNFGAFINITEVYKNRDDGIYFDTDNIDFDGKGTILINGKESVIYPDPRYFYFDDELKDLLKYKIPIKHICAGFKND